MIKYYLRLAWRRSFRHPATTVLIVLTMSIGVAACMTTATIFNALDGEPLPGISNHLYVVTIDARENTADGSSAYVRPNSLVKLRDAVALIDAMPAAKAAALAQGYAQIGAPETGRSYVAKSLMSYGPVSELLGVPLRFGRSWTEDEQAAHVPLALIDVDLAQKLFGTENVVGRNVELNAHPFRIIGVTAPWKPRVAFLDASQRQGSILASNTQLFVPVGAALDAGMGPSTSGECDNSLAGVTFGKVDVLACRWLEVWASAHTKVARADLQRVLHSYAQTQHYAGRFIDAPRARLFDTRAWMSLNHIVPDDVSLNVVFACTFLFLCMVNAAGLLTARFLGRVADVAIRRALGAPVRHIFVQHVVESGLLGFIGGCVALPLTWLGMWIVRKQPVAYAPVAQLNMSVFAGLTVLSILVGLVVGVLPAWRICRLPPALQIKEA